MPPAAGSCAALVAAFGAALVFAMASGAPAQTPTWALPAPHAHIEVIGPEPPRPGADGAEMPAWPVAARLEGPTDRYPHNVLGGIPGWTTLIVTARACGTCAHWSESAGVVLPENRVFEDVAPRLWDVTGDGRPEIVLVESDAAMGARLTIWRYRAAEAGAGDGLSLLAAGPHIGTRFRWLAVAGVADFTGDGAIEIAYVDRPHLARTLRLVSIEGDALVEVASLPGVTNHRIGEPFISGGVRDCGSGPELILASADWSRVLAVRLPGGVAQVQDLGALRGPGSLASALDC